VRPYYSDDSVTIYHGDCRGVLPTLAPLDLIVTDPPYGVGYSYGAGTDDSPEMHWAWFTDVLALMRASARQVVFTHRQEAVRRLTDWDHLCMWHKPFNLTYSIRGWHAKWEPIFVYGGVVTRGAKDGGRPGAHDSWTFSYSTVPNEHGHPAEKPLQLMQRIVSTFSGDVCDPFVGSGTTLVAAKNLGRKAVGIEIEERFCEIAAKRCSQEVLAL
jgi:DNA modification methylase